MRFMIVVTVMILSHLIYFFFRIEVSSNADMTIARLPLYDSGERDWVEVAGHEAKTPA